MLRVNGAQGEGGGQVLRTALAVAAVQGLPLEIHSIRARRKPPGLQPQHLAAVRALQAICHGRLEGAEPGSTRLAFLPGPPRAGDYRFDIGTAGAITLLLQAVLLPLALAPGPSRLRLTGGTHVPWSPPADYLAAVLLPLLACMGLRAQLRVERWGWYPKGGGQVVVEIEGAARLVPRTQLRREGPLRLHGLSAVANLPASIAERQAAQLRRRLAEAGHPVEIEVSSVAADDPGSFLFLVAEREAPLGGFSALGRRGLSAERVADDVADQLLEFIRADAGADPRLADQLLLPMALAGGTSRLTTSRITGHLSTTLALVQQLLGCPVQLSGDEGTSGSVTVEGIADSASGTPRPTGRPDAPEPAEAVAGPGAAGTGACLGSSPAVRKAVAADVPAMQRLLAGYASRGDLLPRTLNELYQHLRDFYVAELGGQVVGMCALFLYWEDLAEIRSLAVQETAGGRGLGSALVRACVAEAGQLGIRRVFALTNRGAFFARLGFRPLDKRELPQKIWKDCIRCAKFACCDEVALIREP